MGSWGPSAEILKLRKECSRQFGSCRHLNSRWLWLSEFCLVTLRSLRVRCLPDSPQRLQRLWTVVPRASRKFCLQSRVCPGSAGRLPQGARGRRSPQPQPAVLAAWPWRPQGQHWLIWFPVLPRICFPVQLNRLPRETLLCATLYALPVPPPGSSSEANKQRRVPEALGWVTAPLFNFRQYVALAGGGPRQRCDQGSYWAGLTAQDWWEGAGKCVLR